MEFERESCCCFTGHRPGKMNLSEQEIKTRLDVALEELIQKGYHTFITGMAQGFDLYAAEMVVEKMKTYPNLRLIGASPYDGFEAHYGSIAGMRYRRIQNYMEQIFYIREHYSRFCFQERNIWMVDRSSVVLAAYNGFGGGTKNTIDYANKKRVQVINILE